MLPQSKQLKVSREAWIADQRYNGCLKVIASERNDCLYAATQMIGWGVLNSGAGLAGLVVHAQILQAST